MAEQKLVLLSRMYWCIKLGLLLICGIFVFSACSSRKHFEPKLVSGVRTFNGKLHSNVHIVSREGALLKDYTLLTLAQGLTPIALDKDSRFLAQNGSVIVIQKNCKDILLMQTDSNHNQNNTLSTIPFDKCVLSATLRENKLAMVAQDNTLLYYDTKTQQEIFAQKYPNVLAVNSYLASPIITTDSIIYPDLEGKVLVYSFAQNKIIKDILINSDKFFNNIVYMYAQGNYLLAATAKRISAIINDKSFKYDVELRDILFYNNKIYVLSIEGEILELDHTLKLLRKVRLPFAVLSGIIIKNNTLYTLEKGGYLIELDLQNFTPLIYKNKLKKQKALFYNADTFFYDKVYQRFE